MNKTKNTLALESFIKESVQTALVEDVHVKRAILENRKSLVEGMIAINEADWFDRARKWVKNKAYGAEQGAKDYYEKNVLVNPKELTSNPDKVKNLLDSSLKNVEKEIGAFKGSALKSSERINHLLDSVTDLFSKFFNLLDEIPEGERGIYEVEVLKVVSRFYLAMTEEKQRIETYLSILSKEAQSQGYNLQKSAPQMATQASRGTEPPSSQPQAASPQDVSRTIPQIARGFGRMSKDQPSSQQRIAKGFSRR
jgi:hypothetical protein